jgi:hypothetical protein
MQLTADCFNEAGKHGISSWWSRSEGGVGASREPRNWSSGRKQTAKSFKPRHFDTCLNANTLFRKMANLILRSAKRVPASLFRGSQSPFASITRRNIATAPTASGDASSLPLAGIKVLDMTRVLAGVGIMFPSDMHSAYNNKAILHANIG